MTKADKTIRLINKGMSVAEACKKTGATTGYIYNRLKKDGVTPTKHRTKRGKYQRISLPEGPAPLTGELTLTITGNVNVLRNLFGGQFNG